MIRSPRESHHTTINSSARHGASIKGRGNELVGLIMTGGNCLLEIEPAVRALGATFSATMIRPFIWMAA